VLFLLGIALNVHWALQLQMESKLIIELAFNTPRVSRKVILKVFLQVSTIVNCERGTAMKSSIGIVQELMYHLV